MNRAVTYNGFGVVAFCQEAEVALERLRIAIADAKRAGFLVRLPSAAYDNAVALHARESGYLTKTYVAWGGACTNLAAELQRATDRLNKEIAAVGGSASPTYRPDYAADPQGWDALPSFAKVAIVVGSIGLVAWGLSSVASVAKVFTPPRDRGLKGPTLSASPRSRVRGKRLF